jgi:aspartate racemase
MLIHNLIARQVDSRPDKVAIISGKESLTYREMIERANQLARLLRDEGVQRGRLVAICLPRSTEMVIAILGSLIAGGAYVPIDPAYPAERIRAILADANPICLITSSAIVGQLPALSAKYLPLDVLSSRISRLSSEGHATVISHDALAYVIYTSGSTGAPKGVMVSHGSLTSFVRISRSVLNVSAEDVYLQSASISYAVAIRQIMVPLSRGASLVIASNEQIRDPLDLFEEIKRTRVTLMDVVPSYWRAITHRLRDLPETARHNLLDNNLRRIVCVGEALPFEIPQEWARTTKHPARLVNIFGQTETTGIVSAYPIPPDPDNQFTGIVPIGTAIAETSLYILDEHQRPVPAGHFGELCISNPCLAEGYLNQDSLTEQKFIPNPFQDGWNTRLYRTGDLARLREDGNLEFLGRGDMQVKIRGQRLELEEVESVLRKFTTIDDCAVVLGEDSSGDSFLAAYIVTANPPLDIPKIKQHCRQFLAEFMVPSTFTYLDKLPLSPNGKLDRRALANLTHREISEGASNSSAPRDEVEEILLRIWGDLLPNKHPGIHDGFFDLGGHSLSAVRMFARIEQEFGKRLPITTLFYATTIAQLADILRRSERDSIRSPIVVPIRKAGNKPILFGVHGVEGGVLFWRSIVNHLPSDQPFYAIQAQGVDGVTPALESIEDMASLYIREIQSIQPSGPYYLCGYSMGGEIIYEMAQQLSRIGQSVGILLMLDTRNPIRLARFASYGMLADPPAMSRDKRANSRKASLWRRLNWHAGRLLRLSVYERGGYVWLLLRTGLERFVILNLVKIFHAAQMRVPDALLAVYLRTIHRKALHSYVPKPYAGNLIIFRSTETEMDGSDDSPLSWKALAREGIEIHRFEADHNIVSERFAPDVAVKLHECLTRAKG